jgi:murein DD-endopeptidase MepM/ murein hydrolase activator NlpD
MICPGCASTVALHEGEPVVTANGVALWHPRCLAMPAVEPVAIASPARRARRWPIPIGASAIALGAAIMLWPHQHAVQAAKQPAAATNVFAVRAVESVAVPARKTAPDDAPPAAVALTAEQRYPVPVVDGQPLSELYPSLIDWIHPVADATEKMPPEPSRHFGAERAGVQRAECGAGHCGIDLDGPRGRAVVAVADGVVVRVERHELGLDGRSGRYVRIEHDDGTLTAYMHLDDIADGLEVGDRVDGGQYLGTLGATACYSAAPHLHFSLEIPNHPGLHGDNTDTHYVDPAPFLVRSHLAPVPDRRHGVKPAT